MPAVVDFDWMRERAPTVGGEVDGGRSASPSGAKTYTEVAEFASELSQERLAALGGVRRPWEVGVDAAQFMHLGFAPAVGLGQVPRAGGQGS